MGTIPHETAFKHSSLFLHSVLIRRPREFASLGTYFFDRERLGSIFFESVASIYVTVRFLYFARTGGAGFKKKVKEKLQ